MSDSWYISTHVILPLQRKLTALNEHTGQPRAHNILLCTLAILFLIFQSISPIDTLIVLENIKLQPIQCSSKEKNKWNKKQTNTRGIALSNEKNKGCVYSFHSPILEETSGLFLSPEKALGMSFEMSSIIKTKYSF